MPYDSRPDAERINKLATRYKEMWSEQDRLDQIQADLIMMSSPLDTAKPQTPQPNNAAKPFRSGIGGIIWREDSSLLADPPGLHVNVVSEDEKDKEHASGLLEPWLAGAWEQSQIAGRAWSRLPGDITAFGRTWSFVSAHPRLWATRDGKEYAAALMEASETGDRDAIKDAKKMLDLFKRDNFPLRWRYVDPRNTWTTFDSETHLPEVVECRSMTLDALEETFGKVPEYLAGRPGTSKTDVYWWANHQYSAVICADKNDSQILSEFEHGMGINPYVLGEAKLLPPNDRGLRWAGILFHARNMIETLDELLTDLRNNHRFQTNQARSIHFDPREYDESTKVAGRPAPVTVEPGTTLSMWSTEEIRPIPFSEIPPQSIQLLHFTRDLVTQNMISPVSRGDAKSGTSQVQFVTAYQIAQKHANPYQEALSDMAKGVAQRFFASVESLSQEYPDNPDEVWVLDPRRDQAKGFVAVTPKDVLGWKNSIQARMPDAIPLDRNAKVAAAQGLQALGVSPEDWLEDTLGYEDPYAVMRRGYRHRLREESFEFIKEQVLLRAQQKLQEVTPQELAEMQELFTGASPGLQQYLQGAGAPASGGLPAPQGVPPQGPPAGPPGIDPGLLQGMANVRRTGVPQQPQGTGDRSIVTPLTR